MEFIDQYASYIGEFITWLSMPETSIPAVKLIQATAALLGTTISMLGFYKAWRYAESRLGSRLNEFLDKEEESLSKARGEFHAIREERSAVSLNHPKLFTNSELKSALKHMGKRRYGTAKAELNGALARTKERADLARLKGELHHRQTAMAHLLLGAIADAESDHQTALIHFQSALDIDETDTEALEYVGLQYLKLGNATRALDVFSRLEAIARARGEILLVAQARRNCGLAYEALPVPKFSNANIAYKDAIQVFPTSGPVIELAQLHELRAAANIKLGNLNQAHASLMHALKGFSALDHSGGKQVQIAREGAKRILAALRELDGKQSGNIPTTDDRSAPLALLEPAPFS